MNFFANLIIVPTPLLAAGILLANSKSNFLYLFGHTGLLSLFLKGTEIAYVITNLLS